MILKSRLRRKSYYQNVTNFRTAVFQVDMISHLQFNLFAYSSDDLTERCIQADFKNNQSISEHSGTRLNSGRKDLD